MVQEQAGNTSFAEKIAKEAQEKVLTKAQRANNTSTGTKAPSGSWKTKVEEKSAEKKKGEIER